MSGKERYVCRVKKVPPDRRDVYRRHADPEGWFEVKGGPTGGVVEYSQPLDEEGVRAFRGASNLIDIEPVVEATTAGWVEEVVEVSAGSVARIPTDEDLSYLRSLFLRDLTDGEGVTLCVVDTGLGDVLARGFLKANVAGARSVISGEGALDERNGHGSHVTTTALPDGAKLLVGKGLSNAGSGGSDGIAALIYWGADNGADVINLSLSGPSPAETWRRALAYARSKGVIVNVAAGNDAQNGNPIRYPAAYDDAVAIGAFDRTMDRKAPFSSYGSYVDFASSGVNVLAYDHLARLVRMSGTSMATPLKSWVDLMLMAALKKSGPEVLQAMRNAARDTPAPATYEGAGVLRGRRAERKLREGARR